MDILRYESLNLSQFIFLVIMEALYEKEYFIIVIDDLVYISNCLRAYYVLLQIQPKK